MALRVTQSHVSVLGDEPAGFDGTGKLRVTQSHVSVLGDQAAGFDGTGNLRATQLHVAVLATEGAGHDGTGTLRATQMHVCVLAGLPPEAVSDTISLNETVSINVGYNKSASDTIALNDESDFLLTAEASDTIALTEDAVGLPGKKASDTIALSEATTLRMGWFRSPSDTVTVQEELLRTIEVEDTLALTEQSVKVVVVEDTISLSEILFNDDRIEVFDIVVLSDTSEIPVDGSDTISLLESVTFVKTGQRDGSDDVVLYESASYIVNADCPECCDVTERYSPFVGTSSDPDSPDPPSTTVPTLTSSHSIVLSHPFDSPTLSMTLRAPLFGNRDRLTNQRIHRESRGGTLIVYSDPQWPKVYTLVMDFAVLSEETAQDYLDFLAATLGKEIRLVDHESRHWRGVLIQPDDPITRNKRCDLSASFVFEGELV
jgi:hypothetical protein